jgi:hypothetical protein
MARMLPLHSTSSLAEIEERAYCIFQLQGWSVERGLDHWLQAEAEFMRELASSNGHTDRCGNQSCANEANAQPVETTAGRRTIETNEALYQSRRTRQEGLMSARSTRPSGCKSETGKSHIVWLVLFLVAGSLLKVHAAGTLRIVGTERLPGNELRLVFQDTGTNVLDYRLAQRPDLHSTNSVLDLRARIVDLGGGYYHTILPQPPASARFYHVAGFTGPDTDGDGLSDMLESRIGTSATTFDTDDDGVGDGVELVRGGDPLSASSQPLIVRANFAVTSSAAREGDGSVNLAVTLTTNYTGRLLYRIADISTALSNQDFGPISGSVTVNGNSVVIPIALLEDTNMEPVKVLAVDLVEDAWADYQVGGASRHLVLLYDNDTHWSGVMGTTNSSQLGFRLRMLRVGSEVVSAALVSELSTNRSEGVGTVPPGIWPVQATLTTNSFHAVSELIPVGTSLLTGNAPLERVFTFTAAAGATNTLVRSNLIVGTFTDTLRSAAPGMAWVGSTIAGTLVLLEDLPAPPPPQLSAATGLGGRAVARVQGGGQ